MLNKNIFKILIVVSAILMSVSSASAVVCTDAGDFASICTSLSGLFNASIALVTIVATGSNASTIIMAAIILAIVTFFIDLARGENSYLRRKFQRI